MTLQFTKMNGAGNSFVIFDDRKGGLGLQPEQVLVRRVTTNLLSQVQVEPQEEVLCRGVRALNFRYFDGTACLHDVAERARL